MVAPADLARYTYSTILLIFSVVLVVGLVFNGRTKLSADISPVVALITLIVSVGWLTMIEGSQASIVGLEPVDMDLYKNSHKTTHMITSMTNHGDNLNRYLLGRQFMVVLAVFTVNTSGAPLADTKLWGFPQWVITVFLGTGLAMILFTCMIGQLNSQVNASLCQLDFINNYFAVFTVWVAMAIEFSGLLHAAYVIEMLVCSMAGEPKVSNEPPRSGVANLFFWGRCIMSIGVVCFCFAVTMVTLFNDQTTVWKGIPTGVVLVIFVLLFCVVGLLEAMQIAFFAVTKIPMADRGDSMWAKKTCELLFRHNGRNLAGFMIGRQLCVVSCMFFVARVVSIKLEDGEENVFGVPDGFQKFMNTGLCGSILLTIVGSIAWQLVAAAFPIAVLDSIFTYVFLVICLGLEATGICGGAWVLAKIHEVIAGFQRDEVYIGTAEERAAKGKGDHDVQLGAGHMKKLPGFAEMAPASLKKLFDQDPEVRAYISSLHKAEEGTDNESA